jgi:hypothetical protein
MLHCNKAPISWTRNPSRRITVQKTSLTIAAVVAIAIAGGTTSFAAQLPTYEVKGLPISPVQAGLLGGADIRQSQVAPSAASPHQLSVLTPRTKVKTATTAPLTVGAGH